MESAAMGSEPRWERGRQATSVGVAVLGLLAAWSLDGARAHACSFIPPCAAMPTIALVGDVTARPTNACIAVQYAESPVYPEPVVAELAYVAADGARTALAPTEVPRVYCPIAPLAPDTDHRLVASPVTDDTFDCVPAEEVELLAFHTGSGPDDAPPSRPGDVVGESCFRDVCDSSACCGPYDTVVHSSTWTPASDDAGEVAYVVNGALRLYPTIGWSESRPSQPTPV